MADYPDKSSDRYVRESTYRVEPAAESNGSMWFILGGIIVALGVLFAIFYGSSDGTTTAPATDPSAVTIENNAAPADVGAIAPAGDADTMTPAPEATAPAPADTAPAAEPETAPTAPAAGN
jgi:hypothetical protein